MLKHEFIVLKLFRTVNQFLGYKPGFVALGMLLKEIGKEEYFQDGKYNE
jgi:hypothetical protein